MELITDPFIRALACAAISPGLQSILVFDSTFETLRLAAQTIAQMLEAVTQDEVVTAILGTFEAEDDLWGAWGIGSESQEQLLQWKLGLLTGGQNNSKQRLVIIPDLTKLSLATARACVMLMGADLAHLERHGQQAIWKPKLCWLAGCASDEVGMVSPHLLDRFALRMGQLKLANDYTTREKELLELLNNQKSHKKEVKLESLSAKICQTLQTALKVRPKISEEAIAHVLNYTNLEVYNYRREIALVRLSLAIAQLDNAIEMRVEHINTAANLIGLERVFQQKEQISREPFIPDIPQIKHQNSPEIEAIPQHQSLVEPNFPGVSEAVYEPNEIKKPETTIVYLSANPYPEDKAAVEREASSLRLPIRKFRSKAAASGVIIGVEKAKNLQDIALVRTLLEATKYQAFRQQVKADDKERLVLHATDLYSYRRVPVAEQMLTLVLDYTCLRDCNWRQELLPYLSWAYVERTSICLIQVGVAKNYHNLPTNITGEKKFFPEELRAERLLERSILVPRIAAGLEAGAGLATPLAHGLDLALQTLRRALQHGRSKVQQAILVVISDGRGNVPLEASKTGKITPPVGTEGVNNALQVAERIRDFKGVKVVLLNPQPRYYADFPLKLGEAMGATIIPIPPFDAEEVEL